MTGGKVQSSSKLTGRAVVQHLKKGEIAATSPNRATIEEGRVWTRRASRQGGSHEQAHKQGNKRILQYRVTIGATTSRLHTQDHASIAEGS